MAKSTWGDVKRGAVVELGGREWTVAKIKPKGKKAKVVVEARGRTAESVVKLSEKVKVVSAKPKREPLTGPQGEQTRWATKREHDKALETPGPVLAHGDDAQRTPPAPAEGDLWESASDRIERKLGALLEARLVAETPDEGKGYYVPPVDVSTIAAHLAIFHGGIPETIADDEGAMLKAHEAQHAAALKGEALLPIVHWHTERRP